MKRKKPLESLILTIRGSKVLLDLDLAEIYGVPTKRLNEQVKRNADRFPEDFYFQLNAREKAEVVANCDHLVRLKFSPKLPFAFTEHGAIMAAIVLNSPQAVTMSVCVCGHFCKCANIWPRTRRFSNGWRKLTARCWNTTTRCAQFGQNCSHCLRRRPNRRAGESASTGTRTHDQRQAY